MSTNKTAVVIPTYKQYSDLNISEIKSYSRTCAVLAAYDIILVSHDKIDLVPYIKRHNQNRIKQKFFARSYFTGLEGYNKLLLSLDFYNCFIDYKYILICQLDVFVFADHLDYFVKKGYDYIGAPWFGGHDKVSPTSSIIGVGNGGFSLRKVRSFIAILSALELLKSREINLKAIRAAISQWIGMLRVLKHEYLRSKTGYTAALPWITTDYEDIYWGNVVKFLFKWFKVGTVKDAIAFAFETNPAVLYALNKHKLPMATHAWEKYDPDFWTTFID